MGNSVVYGILGYLGLEWRRYIPPTIIIISARCVARRKQLKEYNELRKKAKESKCVVCYIAILVFLACMDHRCCENC